MIKQTRKTFAVLKWVAGIVFLLFVAADGVSWYLSIKLRPVITRELKDLVLNATDSLYRIEFSTLNTNLLLGNASVIDVKIIPDTVIFNKLVKLKRAPNNIYEIKLKKLTIRNFHPFRIYRDKKLNVNELLFEHPSVVMSNKQFEFNENKPPRPARSPYAYISKFLQEVSVRTVALKDIRFTYINKNGAVAVADSLINLNITLKDWLIDPHSATDPSRLYLLKDVLIDLNDYKFTTPDSLYEINMNTFSFRASTGQLNIKKFALVPRYPEMDFGLMAGAARERFSIQINDINLKGINLPLYVKKQVLRAREMNINNGLVSVFNNNELPRKVAKRTGKFPHQLLQLLRGKLTVQRLNLNDINLSYAVFDKDTRQKGKITFDHTSGTVLNVTNEEQMKVKNPFMVAKFNTLMMGQGKMMMNFRFDLNAKNAAFTYNGQLTAMEGTLLNRITKPLGMVQVKSGIINKLSFDVSADDTKARGKLDFAYKDLSVILLKKAEGNRRIVKKRLISMLANALVIKPDNPNAKGEFTTSAIYFERDTTASFFNFIWKTLFQGLKYSVGLTPQKSAEINAQITKFEKMVADRDQRREARQKRKEERKRKRFLGIF
jgi:hypothetical protein